MTTIRKAIEDRIRETVTGLCSVAGSADLDAVTAGRVNPPAAYVFEAASKGANQEIGGQQQVNESFAVVIVVSNKRGERGVDSADQCRGLRDQIFRALVGWEPGLTHDAMTYDSGRLVLLKDGLLYWQDFYKTTGVWPG
ncbi:MAG: hypothetical protein HQL07_13000 [Nitrospirae bacterium]|nr:hypothetical protein [Magnetococcales bacterium]